MHPIAAPVTTTSADKPFTYSFSQHGKKKKKKGKTITIREAGYYVSLDVRVALVLVDMHTIGSCHSQSGVATTVPMAR